MLFQSWSWAKLLKSQGTLGAMVKISFYGWGKEGKEVMWFVTCQLEDPGPWDSTPPNHETGETLANVKAEKSEKKKKISTQTLQQKYL